MTGIPGWLIFVGVVLVFGLILLLTVKGMQNAPLYNQISPGQDGVDHADGKWQDKMRKRNRRITRMGVITFVVVTVLGCLGFAAAPKASAVTGALWPSATPTASLTPTASPTRTLKPTLAFTLTPRNSPTPSATQTPLVTQTARIIYQSGGQSVVTQIVSVVRTVIVAQTVIVFQTVIVTPTETPTATETATASEAPTETASPTPTETPTP